MNASFTWPPGGSEPSESATSGPPAAGAFTSINPLANAIDLRTTRTVSQESVPSAAAAGTKWKVIQKAIKSNMAELKAIVQPAGDGSSDSRAYVRMTADVAAAEAAGAASRLSES